MKRQGLFVCFYVLLFYFDISYKKEGEKVFKMCLFSNVKGSTGWCCNLLQLIELSCPCSFQMILAVESDRQASKQKSLSYTTQYVTVVLFREPRQYTSVCKLIMAKCRLLSQ